MEEKRFTVDPSKAPASWRIGKFDSEGRIHHAFDLKRRDDGGISIANIQKSLTDTERQTLMQHFGRPRFVELGGEVDGVHISKGAMEKPGTLTHFEGSVDCLPRPFIAMRPVDKERT